MSKREARKQLVRSWQPSPEERAAMTCGRMAGRATLAQVLLLGRLGYSKERAIKLTKHAASKVISAKLGRS